MTREQILRWLDKHERDMRNALRLAEPGYDRGYFLGRAHACSELTLAIQRAKRKSKKKSEA